MPRPNILLLTIDSLRADMLSCFGCPRPTTPHLDRLAAGGFRFTQAITGGSWTQAAFPPLLTSSYAAMHGGCLGRLAPERPAPIAALAAAGYHTAGFSTTPHLSKLTAYDRGFEHFEDLDPRETDPRLRFVHGGQRLLRHPLTHAVAAGLGRSLRPARCYSSAAQVSTAVGDWISQAQAPFFVWAHYMDVHWPYHVEEELVQPAETAQAWQDLSAMHARATFRRKQMLTAAQQARFTALYQHALHYVDARIGQLLDRLNAHGLDTNTVVIVTADHGEEFLEHGRWGHWESNLFEEIIRVPLIVRVPGAPGGRAVERLVRLLDVMPTVHALAACPPLPEMEGRSLAPLWQAEGAGYDVREALSEMHRPHWHRIAVRTEGFKLIWDSQHPDQTELYDLVDDPRETRNIVRQHPQEARRLQEIVRQHLARAAHSRPEAAPAPARLDAALIRRLQRLGYMD